jgi:predicted Zn-dependent protease
MKIRRWPLLILFALPLARATGDAAGDNARPPQDSLGGRLLENLLGADYLPQRRQDGEKPKLDPKRIINESNGFLKEREPEMNAEEYALYEKVVNTLSTKPEFAVKLLEAMMNDQEPPSPAFDFILGNAYYSAEQPDKAEAHYLSAIKRLPTFLRAWSNLGILYYTAQNYDEAVRCFSKTVTLGDREPMTFGLLGYSLEQQGKVVPAEMAYMQALSGDPSNPDWMEGLLRIYIRGKQLVRAEWLVKDLIRQRPQETRFWLAYAQILVSDNRKLEAIALLETCLGAGVAGPNELNLLADLYAEQKLIPEALAVYRKILADSPDVGERKLLDFDRMLISHGDLDQAQAVLDALQSKVSPEGRINYLLARSDLQMARNQWPAARQSLQDLLTLAPLNGSALLGLARTYAAEDDLPHATLIYEEAVQAPESAYRASLELAKIELQHRHYEKTVRYLEKALSIENNPGVQDLLARVRPLAAETTDHRHARSSEN